MKIEVSEDMRAANITANIRPRRPTGISSLTNFTKALLEHPTLGKREFTINKPSDDRTPTTKNINHKPSAHK